MYTQNTSGVGPALQPLTLRDTLNRLHIVNGCMSGNQPEILNTDTELFVFFDLHVMAECELCKMIIVSALVFEFGVK